MSSSAALRLMSDLRAVRTEPPEGCSAAPHSDDNLFVWAATVLVCRDLRSVSALSFTHTRSTSSAVFVKGPDDTSWEGGVFMLRMTFTESYPDKPPRVRFTSEVFHPNVYTDGTLCMNVLQEQWSPINTICSLLVSIQSLLTDPNPASPANPEAAQLYMQDKVAYNRRVRRCAQKSLE